MLSWGHHELGRGEQRRAEAGQRGTDGTLDYLVKDRPRMFGVKVMDNRVPVKMKAVFRSK
ncbi:hypothetical protein E2C01_077078 [Portunus trituberculatus]|uniref:Uncharacterized protein n=1 Tax=Portunus trituberculatus TaxID=210409 RepID=A0A5B7IAG3_PORTR|nr:hypothetical protein [Portunus trituberculatus]